MKRITKKEEILQLLKKNALKLDGKLEWDFPELPKEERKILVLKLLLPLYLSKTDSGFIAAFEDLKKERPELFLQLQNIKPYLRPNLLPLLNEIHKLFLKDDFDLLDLTYIYEGLIGPEDGVYFTQPEFIEKAIGPLFLEELEEEVRKADTAEKQRIISEKIRSLKLLDPACGAGNFLIYSFYRLNALNEQLRQRIGGPALTLKNFTGYEIRPELAEAARLLLSLLSEENANIVTADAVIKNWQDDLPDGSYIVGNPPYLGARKMSSDQKNGLMQLFKNTPNKGNLDYSSCWLKKAAEHMNEGQRAVYICTDSLFQGQSVHDLWQPILKEGVEIDFAYPSLKWDNRQNNAEVNVSIVSFSKNDIQPKLLFEHEDTLEVDHINAYLTGRPDVFVESKNEPFGEAPKIGIGNKPIDGGFLLFTERQRDAFIKKEPQSRDFFRPFYGSKEFLKGTPRYCLWLGDRPKEDYENLPEVMNRLEAVRRFRKGSKSPGTVRIADRPEHFHVENFPPNDYFVIPRIIAPDRDYLPMGPLPAEAIASDSVHILSELNYPYFALLSSHIHMIWTKAVCGRYGSALRYSAKIVYNNFPWPQNLDGLEETAREILKARDPEIPLGLQYDPNRMPEALKRAHRRNDEIVAELYKIPSGDNERVLDHLFRLYEREKSN